MRDAGWEKILPQRRGDAEEGRFWILDSGFWMREAGLRGEMLDGRRFYRRDAETRRRGRFWILDFGLMGEILETGGGGDAGCGMLDAGWEKILPQRRGGRKILDSGLMRANQRIELMKLIGAEHGY